MITVHKFCVGETRNPTGMSGRSVSLTPQSFGEVQPVPPTILPDNIFDSRCFCKIVPACCALELSERAALSRLALVHKTPIKLRLINLNQRQTGPT